jgi:hypothetical protein
MLQGRHVKEFVLIGINEVNANIINYSRWDCEREIYSDLNSLLFCSFPGLIFASVCVRVGF